jgi:hypothetical protein
MQAAGVQDRAFDPYLAADVDVLALVRDTAEDAQVLHHIRMAPYGRQCIGFLSHCVCCMLVFVFELYC